MQCLEPSSDTEYPQSIWLKTTLHSCEVITCDFLNASAADKTDLFDIVFPFWRQISEFINVCTQSALKSVVDDCASTGKVWYAFYGLLELLYKAGKDVMKYALYVNTIQY